MPNTTSNTLVRLVDATREAYEQCSTYVPIEGLEVPANIPAPVWLISLICSMHQFSLSFNDLLVSRSYAIKNNQKLKLVHGLNWFSKIVDELLSRWEWPSRTQCLTQNWGETVIAALALTPDDRVRYTDSGRPTFMRVDVKPDGMGDYRMFTPAGLGSHRRPVPIELPLCIDHCGLQVYDLSSPNGPVRMLVVVTSGEAMDTPIAFILDSPPIPSIHDDELTNMGSALAMIDGAMQKPCDPLLDQGSSSLTAGPEESTNDDSPPANKPNPTSEQQTASGEQFKESKKHRKYEHGKLDASASALLVMNPGWTNKQIADELGCNVKTLSKPDLKLFRTSRKLLAAEKNEYRDSNQRTRSRHENEGDGSER